MSRNSEFMTIVISNDQMSSLMLVIKIPVNESVQNDLVPSRRSSSLAKDVNIFVDLQETSLLPHFRGV